MLGPQNRPHVPSRTAKSSKKGNLRVLRAVQRCQNNVLVIPDDLPRRPWGCLRASSWDLCPTKRRQLDGFWRKNLPRSVKQRKSEFLKILQNSWFFNGFPCFLRGARRLFCYVFLWNVSNCQYLTRISKKCDQIAWGIKNRSNKSSKSFSMIYQYSPLEFLWASSWDLWDTRIAPSEAFWREKTHQKTSKYGKH